MRSISNSMDVHGVRYTERMKRMQRIKKVMETEKKEDVKQVGYYESRGMTQEDKERKSSMTPQEAFRREIAQTYNSKMYVKLQDESTEKCEENNEIDRDDETEK